MAGDAGAREAAFELISDVSGSNTIDLVAHRPSTAQRASAAVPIMHYDGTIGAAVA